MDTMKKKVGVRVESRFHEILPYSDDAFGFFAGMADLAAEDGSGEFTKSDADDFIKLVSELFEPDDETTDFYTEGELYYGGGKLEIRYREPCELSSVGGVGGVGSLGETVTSVYFEEENRELVTITRGGAVYSALVLERGVRHTCAYNTCSLPIVIYTTAKRVDNRLTPSGGVLDLIYTVETQSGPAQYNRATVTVNVTDGDEACDGESGEEAVCRE